MYRRFFGAFGVLAAVMLLVVGAFNGLIDPYGVWKFYRQVGVNQWTPKADDLDRLIKPIEVIDKQPQTLFLGDSQVLWGIDPADYTKLTGEAAYNYGLRGATLYELRRSLEHVIAVDKDLRKVYLNVSFAMFSFDPRIVQVKARPGFDEEQLGKKHITLGNIEKTLFSWQAFEDSCRTVSMNRKEQYEDTFYTEGGHPTAHSIRDYYKDKPYPFLTSFIGEASQYANERKLKDESFEELERILQLCRENGIEIQVVSLPVHARFLEMIDVSSPIYAEYLARLTELTPVSDFTGYDEYSEAANVGSEKEVGSNPYFWDTHHPKDLLGAKVIGALLGKETSLVGSLVTRENVAEHLQSLRDGRCWWEQSHPESMEEVRHYTGRN